MRNTQHTGQCQVFLHPTACSSRLAINAIQQRTGRLAITTPKGNAQAVSPAIDQHRGHSV